MQSKQGRIFRKTQPPHMLIHDATGSICQFIAIDQLRTIEDHLFQSPLVGYLFGIKPEQAGRMRSMIGWMPGEKSPQLRHGHGPGDAIALQ